MNSSTVKAFIKKTWVEKEKGRLDNTKDMRINRTKTKKENTNNQLGLKDQLKETHLIQHKKGLRKVHGGTCKRNFVYRIAKDTEEVASRQDKGTLYCITKPVNE